MKKIELYNILGATAKRLGASDSFMKGMALDSIYTNRDTMQAEIHDDRIPEILVSLSKATELTDYVWFNLGAVIKLLTRDENKGE